MAVGWGALYVRMEKSCRGYAPSADTRSLLAKKCLLCTITARSILHGEYKWRNFVDADNSGVMSGMYEGWEIKCTHCRFASFSSVRPGTFKTDTAHASSALLRNWMSKLHRLIENRGLIKHVAYGPEEARRLIFCDSQTDFNYTNVAWHMVERFFIYKTKNILAIKCQRCLLSADDDVQHTSPNRGQLHLV